MKLHHVRRGAGEPLLLIQGMSGHHLHWGERFMAALEADFDCIAIDHRNTGMSPQADEPFTLGDLAEDAAAVLDELALGSAHVMGISMGGMVAQELVLRHPEKLRSLVLGCTYAGGAGQQLSPPETLQILMAGMQSGDRAKALRAAWGVNVSEAFAADEANYEAFAEISAHRPVAVAVIMRQMQAIAQHDTSVRLGEIEAPTLVIHGTDDRMLPYANGEAIARMIPGARLETLEGVGHMFWTEQPERSAQLVRDHCLASVER
ncbi:MAG: alpha/beta fold hydrolase [Solirubrobacteraceae bacterium]